jgi:hypothetical protein
MPLRPKGAMGHNRTPRKFHYFDVKRKPEIRNLCFIGIRY